MSDLDIDAIKSYLIKVGCKIEYPILVNAFKQYLYNPDPQLQGHIRTRFKDYVNRLATVSLENNMKFIILRPEFRPQSNPISPTKLNTPIKPPPPTKQMATTIPTVEPKQEIRDTINRSQPMSPQDCLTNRKVLSPKQNHTSSPTSTVIPPPVPRHQILGDNNVQPSSQMPPPRPPPRRRQSNASLFSNKQVSIQSRSNHELNDLANKSPGKVREHASKFNSHSIAGDLHSISNLVKSHSMREGRLARDSFTGSVSSASQRLGYNPSMRSRSSHREDESDSSSLQPIEQLRKKWMIEACNCNYNCMVALLREDPKLASLKDPVGYTALHWAAKTGNKDIIKLIAGTHGVSTDTRSNFGYTPLHLAYMFKREETVDLLLKHFNANPSIRDFSGRKPQSYQTLAISTT